VAICRAFNRAAGTIGLMRLLDDDALNPTEICGTPAFAGDEDGRVIRHQTLAAFAQGDHRDFPSAIEAHRQP